MFGGLVRTKSNIFLRSYDTMKITDTERMDQLRFDGRVAVVTGAGGGLGKCYALLLASRGAKVVVNDLGGSRDGSGKSSNLADAVVKEIKDKGGIAVADYNSVVDGDKLIKTALDNFGRIDILINNAGILRDRSFARISDQDWDLIHAVHLKGAFKCTQAAWELFKKQKFGRVIMTSSNAGVCGNFGQANYSAAKLGLIGLANTLAIEGAKYNILVNTIVPTARSRLTEDIMSPDMLELLKPEFIAPVVAYMCHESFTETSQVIDANLGFGTKIQYYDGGLTPLRAKISDDVTIESVQEAWPKLTEMSKLVPHNNIRDQAINSMQAHMELQEREQMDGNRPTSYNTYTYDEKDVKLYALGVGASVENKSDLRFLYENHEKFNMLPTFLVLPGVHLDAETATLISQNMPPGKHADFSNILHGEQYIEIEEGKLPGTSDELTVRSYVASVLDKGSAAIVIMNSEIYNKEKEKIGRTQQHIFVLGQGGFGGPRTSNEAVDIVPVPKRSPDAVVSQKTSENQAALYRLSGDLNPLHIDGEFAAQMGQPKVILHGLCSLGFAGRHVLATYGGNDPLNFKAMKVRFMKPVIPGQTLVTEMWLEGKRVHFQTKVKETGTVAVGAAYVDLHNVVSGAVLPNKVAADLKSDSVFAMIKEELTKNPAKAKAVKGVFHFVITDGGKPAKKWTLDLKTIELYEGESKTKVDTTITVSDADFSDVAAGKLNPQQAFMKGKLKLSGNIMLMQKLAPLLKSEAKL